MLTLARAREVYAAERARAGQVMDEITGPAKASLERAGAEAAAIGAKIPREVMDDCDRQLRRGLEAYEAIVAGPRAQVDAALRAEGVALFAADQ